MDETAEAIARQRETARAEKAAKNEKVAAEGMKAQLSHAPTGSGNRKSPQVAPPSATRRQKSGGA